MMLDGRAVVAIGKKQPSIAITLTKTEYVAASNGAKLTIVILSYIVW